MDQPAKTRTRLQPLAAWRALRRLIANPEKTEEVFKVIRALSGPALERGYRRFARTDVGARVLRENIDLLDTLNNREALAALPAQTLGRHYLNFVTSEKISADGLVAASENDEFANLHPELSRFATRQRDMHDLWHTLTQYGRSELGEVCLLAFTYAQTRNRGVGVICLAGCRQLSKHYGSGVYRIARRAYRAGKAASWLPAQDWESLIALPIDEVRAMLNIPAPEAYFELMQKDAVAA